MSGSKNDPQSLFGWFMYDWANSAYATTIMVGLLPAYFAEVVVGREGVVIGGTTYEADTLWAFTVGVATFIAFLTAPVLGAIADFSAPASDSAELRLHRLPVFAAALLSERGDVAQTLLIFLIAQVGFTGANVFYDSFLPRIASDDQMDWVSGRATLRLHRRRAAVRVGAGAGGAARLFGLTQAQAARIGM
jgi:UMF1 family MFS transporter